MAPLTSTRSADEERSEIDLSSDTLADLRELATKLASLVGEPATSRLLDAAQAAAMLNVPRSWIAAEARAGRIPHVRLGRYVRFDRDELARWCAGRSVGPRPRHVD